MPSQSPPPKVIFFDAVGTLFGVKGSVGEVYSSLAQSFGVEVGADALNHAFFQSFRKAPPMTFPGVDITTIPYREFEWWKAIAIETFEQAGVIESFTDFDQFFDELYALFATATPWEIYPDTMATLHHWKIQGIDLGILSNFDSRIHRVMDSLSLSEFFSSITISTEVGAAKPDYKIFEVALKKHDCPPQSAWHVGDSYKEDYEGAKAAGLRPIWLKRRALA
ncbi:MAG: HAD-IA family hydrolase [Elainellaceae cyanobacterium]